VQVEGQLMPAGLLITVPPAETVTVSCGIADCVKVAVTDDAALIPIVHTVVPVHAPLQPAKI
jgi:hypothetical protein